MKHLLSEFRAAIISILVLAVVCCGLYPVVVFGLSQLLFPDKAKDDNRV
jgi:K+-transporting ATPase ATPase C chain